MIEVGFDKSAHIVFFKLSILLFISLLSEFLIINPPIANAGFFRYVHMYNFHLNTKYIHP